MARKNDWIPRLDWPLVGFLASLILFIFPWTFDPFCKPRMFAAAVFLVAMSWRVRCRSSTLLSLPGWLLMLAFSCSMFFSVDLPTSLIGEFRMPFQGLLQMALYALCFNAGIGPKRGNVSKIIVCLALPMCAYAIAQSYGFDFEWNLSPSPVGRSSSTLGNPVFLGSMLAAILPLALDIMESDEQYWLTWLAVAGFIVLAAQSTHSKSAVLGLIIGTGAYYLATKKLAWKWAALGFVLLMVGGVWYEQHKSKSDSERAVLHSTALEMTQDPAHWWFGSGPDTFGQRFRQFRGQDFIKIVRSDRILQGQAHNDILQIETTMGHVGVLVYLGFIVLALTFTFMAWPAAGAAMAAVWVISWIEPIPFATIALCCFLCGEAFRSSREGFITYQFPFKRHWSLIVPALACAAVSGIMFAADLVYSNSSTPKGWKWAMWMNPAYVQYAEQYFQSAQNVERLNLWAHFQPQLHPNDARAFQVAADAMMRIGADMAAAEYVAGAKKLDVWSIYTMSQMKTLGRYFTVEELKSVDTSLRQLYNNGVRDGLKTIDSNRAI